MAAKVRVIHMRQKADPEWVVVNACSNTTEDWQRDLSPFFLGPCWLYDDHWSQTMENAWQYSKLYAEHADENGQPTQKYWDWARAGWDNPRAVRYPMGRGVKPLCSLWRGKRHFYVEARKEIYGPLYRDAVLRMPGYGRLKKMQVELDDSKTLAIRDFDGYDSVAQGKTFTQVLNDPSKKAGHAFFLAMLLTLDDEALHQLNREFLEPKGMAAIPPNARWGKTEEKKE